MTTLKDLDRIVPGMVKQLQEISNKMSIYSKIDTDYRARVLMSEIKAQIEQINTSMKIYKSSPAFTNYNFDNFVARIKNYVIDDEGAYQRIKRFENITDYH